MVLTCFTQTFMKNLQLELYTPFDKPTYSVFYEIIAFLRKQTSSEKEHIQKAIEYAVKDRPSYGGFILRIKIAEKTVAVAILNQTGLAGIMPNYLVSYLEVQSQLENYAEVHQLLLKKSIELTNGELGLLTTKKQDNLPFIQFQKVQELPSIDSSNDNENNSSSNLRRES